MDDRAAAAAVKRGYSLRNAGDVPGALQTFLDVIAKAPRWKDAYIGWETCVYDDTDELLRATRARLDAFPVETVEELGWWFERLMMRQPPDLASAGLLVERLLSLHPDEAAANFAHARWLMGHGDPASACDALYKVVASQPQTDSAWLASELDHYADFDPLITTDLFRALIARIDALRGRLNERAWKGSPMSKEKPQDQR